MIAEVKLPPRNQEAIEILEACLEKAKTDPDMHSVLVVMCNRDTYYNRHTTDTSPIELIGQLELTKVDLIRKIYSE